ncbi:MULTISPECIES: tRNA (adenosine(37)-N6)-dimethylallyltransferase MiaA [unclassified Saccharibacter]|uniref:tRNA (adenosine(37)-N6)-dimethylallyltransferase MiaA n=1 Tax=unclassified Saccharibacter TaxID=2648722 RepID=UPI001322DA89|nr:MULTISPECIES: tRNA (adenosine(37)-N6)-dimethylallyltransferase MiaA [unclassified Saccharibacter]MXV36390.1 tRNA (adenosine(37)-N6)-dimethylallyltransferase MiaA [Saccharibacter sp. EH611]MXV57552.1 tRNA (adenosine(37)-N6)-dimethylallyltransferase MiaA [Saccharibacter sp. EH70]MXV65141.1 tRNA (adenosine(37)-N6)-dimethylallyltransferase MiaA [Saccharibacter sp. EH60]
MNAPDNAVIVAGPTCSGKSALALHLARQCCGVVINADSMQVYRDLHILTARPTGADEAAVPHRLYGVLEASQPGSVAWWRQQALKIMQECWAEGRLPILCGGTGMYLRALTDGLVEVPDPGDQARHQARALLADIGPEALHERLSQMDPETASRLKPNDSQRIARAWEVRMGTGRGLAAWQREPALPAAPCRFVSVRLDPPRDELRAAIARRFDAMLEAGACDEVAALLAQNLPDTVPAMRAHGVPELARVLRGESSLEEARETAVRAIGRYTRRQATWFRHHRLGREGDDMVSFHRMSESTQLLKREMQKIENFIQNRIDPS